MSVAMKELPQRRKSLGPVSPKRIYRSLSVRLRSGESPMDGDLDVTKHQCKALSSTIRPSREAQQSCWVCFYTSLWEAVESEDTMAVQSLLSRDRSWSAERGGGGGAGAGAGAGGRVDRSEQRDKWVNAMSEQGLVPLDVAVLTHNSPLLQVLIKAGARHNPYLCRPSEWALKLDALVSVAAQRVEEQRRLVLARSRAPLHLQASAQRQLHLWTLRHQLYCKMRDSFHLTDLPGPPSSAALQVTSATSLSVSVREPAGMANGLITRYRVEWSTSETFEPMCGTGFITHIKSPVFSITGLATGTAYYVRVSAYNVRGWGPPQTSSPPCAAPSSWLECSGVRVRSRAQETAVGKILEQIREPHYRGFCTENGRQLSPTKRLSVSRSLKQLFQSATKFVRLLQRGVYLATIFYYKDNFLATGEEQFPMVEIQCCSTSIIQDFLWFSKLSCAWQQVPWLQQALGSSLSSSSSLLQNRLTILRAVAQLQSSLGTSDLGQVYYEPLRDRQGNVLLVTMRECSPPSHPPDPPLRWVPMARLDRNRCHTPLLPEPTAMDTLTDQLKEKLSYHRRSMQQAQPGLYVGILKLCSSVEQLRVLVPQRLPNLLCHARVRTNPHVAKEEWQWLQRHAVHLGSSWAEGEEGGVIDSSGVEEFVHSLRSAVTNLLTRLNIPVYRAYQYRVYTQELLQFGESLSMLLLLPPSEEFSASYWPLEGAQDPGITMPLQIFELVHFWAYARGFLSQYCQAWLRLELDVYLSQQALREALDTKEVVEARERLNHITQLSKNLEDVWREARWIMDVMQCVRAKRTGGAGAVPLGLVMGGQPPPSPDVSGEGAFGDIPIVLPPHMLNTEGTDSTESADAGRLDLTTSGGALLLSNMETSLPSTEEYEPEPPTPPDTMPFSISTQYLSPHPPPPPPPIFCTTMGAHLLPDIPEEEVGVGVGVGVGVTVPCLQPDLLNPCSLHEEGLGEEQAMAVVGDMLGMLDHLDLRDQKLMSLSGLEPRQVDANCMSFSGLDPQGDTNSSLGLRDPQKLMSFSGLDTSTTEPNHRSMLGAEGGTYSSTTTSILSSCSRATDSLLRHAQMLCHGESGRTGVPEELGGLQGNNKQWASEQPSVDPFSSLPSLQSPLPPGATVSSSKPSPASSGQSALPGGASRGSGLPMRSAVAWVTTFADQQS